jgi:CRISPR-associated protein Csd2
MTMATTSAKKLFPRGTGLLIIEVRHSNPNGDPDQESEPRTIESDGRGLISPVSLKRKLRDLVAAKDGVAWQETFATLRIDEKSGNSYGILETRGRDRATIGAMDQASFTRAFWDGRIFGNTFLEENKDADGDGNGESGDGAKSSKRKSSGRPGQKTDDADVPSRDHFISTGVVQFGVGVSVSPVEIERLTTTNKSGVQEGKDRGMAPLGWRVVRHAVYAMPFFVNPMMASRTNCTSDDINILKFLVPHAYSATASAIRPFVEVRHAWYAEHTSPLGSCPDSLILDALSPKRRNADDLDTPSTSIAEYDIPVTLPDNIQARLASFDDLCAKRWSSAAA